MGKPVKAKFGTFLDSVKILYIFSLAPVPELPDMDADGLVTIYRGMGELSQPPERAISWSTHPGNALWFATHCGRGTHIAVARVRPEQIVAHYAAFYNENEVIVRPGTITDYHYEDMIPVTEASMAPLLAAALPDYLFFGRQARKLGYKEEGMSPLVPLPWMADNRWVAMVGTLTPYESTAIRTISSEFSTMPEGSSVGSVRSTDSAASSGSRIKSSAARRALPVGLRARARYAMRKPSYYRS